MGKYTIEYSETYAGRYIVMANNENEAKEKLFNAIFEGSVDSPEECIESNYIVNCKTEDDIPVDVE